MTSIGSEIRKILERGSYWSVLRAYGYAGLVSGGPWVLSIFKAADGKDYSTLDGGLASLASSLIGKTTEVEYEERINAKGYTNYSLTGIELAGAGEVAVVAQPQDQGLTYTKSKDDQFRTKEQKEAEALSNAPAPMPEPAAPTPTE